MKVLTKYRCDICAKEYLTPDEATSCESRGKEEPIVDLFEDVEYKIFIDDIECWFDATVYQIKDVGHYFIYELGENHAEFGEESMYYPRESIYGNESFRDFCRLI